MKMNLPDKSWPQNGSAEDSPPAKDALQRGSEGNSQARVSTAKSPPEDNLLFDKLHNLPLLTPSPELTRRVAQAALAELAGQSGSALPVTEQTLNWRAYLAAALYRAALPSALAGATFVYLSWAISAASHLY